MSFSNLEYFYSHLPARFRRADKDSFLKRYLQFFGETLDGYDDTFDAFFENINPETATEEWMDAWLENLFGWSWFPRWFTAQNKRELYANFARHLARRGTARGIELWLADFKIAARVHTRPTFTGGWVWGEARTSLSEPLVIVVEILFAEMQRKTEMSVIGENAWGESTYSVNEPLFTNAETNSLLRYVQPQAQEILIINSPNSENTVFDPNEFYWETLEW